MKDEASRLITEEELNMYNLSEYIHTAVGEASTLFYRNDEQVFDDSAAIKLSERLIKGVTKLVDDARFEQMVFTLLSLPDNELIIPKNVLKDSVKDYEVVTMPDSRLSGVKYQLKKVDSQS